MPNPPMMGGRHARTMGKPAQRPSRATVLRLLSYFKDYAPQLALVLVCILCSALAGVLGMRFVGSLIDDYIAPMLLTPNPDFSGLARAMAVMACIYLVGAAGTLCYNRTMAKVSQGILKRVRDEMFAHLQRLPLRYFDTHTHGDLMSRFTNDADTLRQMLSQSVPQFVSSICTVAAVFFAMVTTSIPMTLFVVLFVFFITRVAGFISGKSGGFFVRQQKSLGALNGYIEEIVTGQKVVKVFCREQQTAQTFNALNDTLCADATSANRFANILMPVMANLGNLQYVLLAMLGGALALRGVGGLTLGGIASFLLLSRNFTMPVTQMATQLNSVIMAFAGAQRIFEVMDEPEEADNGYVTLVNANLHGENNPTVADHRTGSWAWRHPHADGSVTYHPLCGDVRFYDVDFGYNPEKLVLHNITLYAKPGQKVAFVGATGAGKTTITNLINRFYDLADGKIRYDDINVNKIKKADLRRSLGMVLQDTHLFTATVMENIRFGRLEATDEECIAAARLANADSFIRLLPNGYQTVLSGDGAGLSQGQRQLLAIARAAVADPPVMILDEATSSIDTRTELIVQKGMDALMRGRTVFVIAHRLSTVQNADVIMVLDQGRIIERGTHEQLLAERGRYYQLYNGGLDDEQD